MKNTIIISFLSVLLLACGGSGDGPSGSTTTPPVTDPSDDTSEEAINTDAIPIRIPVQNSMDLSVDIFNPYAWDLSGNTVTATVRLADRFGRQVDDGTRVNFTTEGGSIQDHCLTAGGGCSVVWTGQNCRPGSGNVNAQCENPLNDRIGMSTITAWAVGEAGFIDKNQNGLFDVDETFYSYGEPFEDVNKDGVRDETEEHLADSDNNGAYTEVNSDVFLGSSCSSAARSAGHCPHNMHISANTRIVMSGGALVVISIYTTAGVAAAPLQLNTDYVVILQDTNGNIPATGTTLSLSAEGLELKNTDGAVANSTGSIAAQVAVLYPGVTFTGLPEFGAAYRLKITDEDSTNNSTVGSELVIEATKAQVGAAPDKLPIPINAPLGT